MVYGFGCGGYGKIRGGAVLNEFADPGDKIDIYTEPYTKFVVQELVGIKGKSESDVANFIIKDWIGDHMEELAQFGIDVEKAKKKAMIE